MASHKQHRQQQQQQHRQPYRYLAVLDFEASCDNARTFSSQEIIELPCVVIDAHLPEAPIVCEFHRYVQPVLHPALPAFCTEQTGIEQHTVDAADPFPVVHAAFAQFIADRGLTTANTLMVTCGDWDLKTMLPLQLTTSGIAPDRSPQLLKSWCNIKTAFQALYYRPRQVGMAGMLQVAGLPLVGRHHSGIDDSRNIAAIARRMLQLGHIFLPTSGAASGGPTSHALRRASASGAESAAGITTTLNARTSILAAANPQFGRYNTRLRPTENINLPAALLSRFDVLFLILDKPDFEDDIRLATHVTYVHQNNRHMERQGEQNAVDPTALKCYISMARSVAPRLTATTAGFLVNAYAHLRQREDVSELQYTCARTLLSLIRMATALARLRFSEDVDEGEVEEALRLLEVSKASVNNKVGGKAEDPISSIYRIIREMSSEGRSAGQIAKEVDIPSIRSRITARGIGDDDLQRCIEHYSDANLWIVGRNGKALVWVTADDDDDEEDDSNADPRTRPHKKAAVPENASQQIYSVQHRARRKRATDLRPRPRALCVLCAAPRPTKTAVVTPLRSVVAAAGQDAPRPPRRPAARPGRGAARAAPQPVCPPPRAHGRLRGRDARVSRRRALLLPRQPVAAAAAAVRRWRRLQQQRRRCGRRREARRVVRRDGRCARRGAGGGERRGECCGAGAPGAVAAAGG